MGCATGGNRHDPYMLKSSRCAYLKSSSTWNAKISVFEIVAVKWIPRGPNSDPHPLLDLLFGGRWEHHYRNARRMSVLYKISEQMRPRQTDRQTANLISPIHYYGGYKIIFVFELRILWIDVVRYDTIRYDNTNNNNNIQDNVYGAVIMAEPLREFTRFIWWM